MRINAIVLAAGESKRFGDNKLSQIYKGQAILSHLLKKLEQVSFNQVYVITSMDTQTVIDEKMPFPIRLNLHPEKGISSSIKLGLEASEACEAYCFIVADQIALQAKTIEAMIQAYKQGDKGILCASFKGELGNPTIFSSYYKNDLMKLEGDVGGKKVLKAHLDDVTLFEVSSEKELMDIDTKRDWNRLLMEE